MTNMHNNPAIEVEWTCGECDCGQVEAVTDMHETTDPLVCGECLGMTGVHDLDKGEAQSYYVAMREARAMEVAV